MSIRKGLKTFLNISPLYKIRHPRGSGCGVALSMAPGSGQNTGTFFLSLYSAPSGAFILCWHSYIVCSRKFAVKTVQLQTNGPPAPQKQIFKFASWPITTLYRFFGQIITRSAQQYRNTGKSDLLRIIGTCDCSKESVVSYFFTFLLSFRYYVIFRVGAAQAVVK